MMPDTLLLEPSQVDVLFTHIDARNAAIQTLGESDKASADYTPRLILAFWLGNSILNNLLRDIIDINPLLRGYLYILELDKKISTLTQSTKIQVLRRYQTEFVRYFNSNYSLYLRNPTEFFFEIINIPDNTAHTGMSLVDHLFVEEAQQHKMRLLLNKTIDPGILAKHKPTYYSLFTLETGLSEFVMRKVSQNYDEPLLPEEQFENNSSLALKVLLFSGKNNVILEGLLAENPANPGTIVLAQIARNSFQGEYLKKSIRNFSNFFEANFLLLNHSNYSTRCEKHVLNPQELAQDLFLVAQHLHQQGKSIVLYAMCGGVPHTALAAYLLHKNGIPFKLILDRFTTNYGQMKSSKAIMRYTNFQYFHSNLSDSLAIRMKVRAYIFAFIMCGFFAYLILELFQLNMNFSQVLRLLPQERVLILQARSCKNDPQFIDYTVHPADELRRSFKKQRQAIKEIFRNLHSLSSEIANCAPFLPDISLQSLYKAFACCFEAFLYLIDDEKLIHSSINTVFTNLHGQYIYNLSTRSGVPLQKYVRGFFKPSTINCLTDLDRMSYFPIEIIKNTIQNVYGINETSDKLSVLMDSFLKNMVQHKKIIAQFANRAFMTNQTDLIKPLRNLLESDIYARFTDTSCISLAP